MAESSFGKGFGAGCGGTTGVLLAVGCFGVVLLAGLIGGCALLVGGCFVGIPAFQKAQEAAERVRQQHEKEARAEWRSWKDEVSGLEVEAQFVRVHQRQVELRTREGKIVEMRIDRLSQPDREWLDDFLGPDEKPTPSSSASSGR